MHRLATAILALVLSGPASASEILYAAATNNGGYFDGRRLEPSEAPRLDQVLAQLPQNPTDDIVIQLVSDGPDASVVTHFHDPSGAFVVRFDGGGRKPGEPSRSLAIRGIKNGDAWLTEFNGPDIEDTKTQACSTLGEDPGGAKGTTDPLSYLSTVTLAEAPAARGVEYKTFALALQRCRINCLAVLNSSHVAVENVAFNSCWLPAIYISNSHHISVRNSLIEGSSYAIVAVNGGKRDPGRLNPSRSHDYVIKDNLWIQDPGDATVCNKLDKHAPCPGKMWREWPWGVTHDGEYEYYNGALFGSTDIQGVVQIRHNEIRNAYNGVRMTVSKDCQNDSGCWTETNQDVVIDDNFFSFVRDNPVEPEGRAVRWHISGNRFFNGYALISLDGVTGGPVYVYGNAAWFGGRFAMPGDLCTEQAEWVNSMPFDFKMSRVATERPTDYDPFCATHNLGTAIKLSPERPDVGGFLRRLYVFNNSWLLRGPVIRGGHVNGLYHWNNAIDLRGCGSNGPDYCRQLPTEAPEPHRLFPTQSGRALFFNGFAFSRQFPSEAPEPYLDSVDYDFSVEGFPLAPEMQGFEEHGIKTGRLFRDPEQGDLSLFPDSAARGAGCAVRAVGGDGQLVCTAEPGDERPDIGAIQAGGQVYRGPFNRP